jgi:sulfatase maturation enzyme AslB (radical SAM superfamily)
MIDAKKKFFLFKKTKHFCSVPWNHIKVSMNGDLSTCVYGTKNLGNLSTVTIDNVIFGEKLQKIRADLFNDKEIDNCQMCKSHENDQYLYLRNLYNPLFISSDVDYTQTDKFVLSGVDLHWSSICNLKCITCWPNQSSSLAIEQGIPILHTPKEHAIQLIDFIIEKQDTLKEIYLSGGEPTLIKYNLLLLQKLKKREGLHIRINTNMTFDLDNQIINELKKFPNVLVTISADSLNERFEYIRRGASWAKFCNNLTELQSYHFKWRVNSVFFVCSALQLTNTFNFFRDNFKINDFTINQLHMDHPDLKARNLPQKVKEQCLALYEQEVNQDENLKGQLANCIHEIKQTKTHSYREYLNKIDTLTGKNWQNIFPELTNE